MSHCTCKRRMPRGGMCEWCTRKAWAERAAKPPVGRVIDHPETQPDAPPKPPACAVCGTTWTTAPNGMSLSCQRCANSIGVPTPNGGHLVAVARVAESLGYDPEAQALVNRHMAEMAPKGAPRPLTRKPTPESAAIHDASDDDADYDRHQGIRQAPTTGDWFTRVVEVFRGQVVASLQADDEREDIHAAFPTRSGRHDLYSEAMRLVGERHAKSDLVELVTWLLLRAEEAEKKR